MTDRQSQRHLYIVRHGEAKPKDVDPERGLTDAGRTNVTDMAAWAATAGIRVDAIRHSGKLRAQQTAVIFAEHLGAQAVPAIGLAPNDDVADLAKAIESEPDDIMLVGHWPFLERLAAQLVAGNAHSSVVTLEAGALLELTLMDERWTATCLMQPRLLSGT
jgi:phosphohistidine phosphatase